MPDAVPATSGAVQPVELSMPAPYQRPSNALESLLERATEGPDPNNVPEVEGSEEKEEQVVVAQPDPGVKGNPYARIRVLEREKKVAESRERERTDQLNQIIKALESGQAVEEEEDLTNVDPITRLGKKTEAVDEKLDLLIKQREDDQKLGELARLESFANEQIREFSKKADAVEKDLYKQATAHYVNVLMSEMLEDTDMSQKEAEAALSKKIADMKVRFAYSGKNPGEEFFKRAILHGFQMPKKSEKIEETPAAKPSAREQIGKAKDKSSILSSLSSVQGTSKREGVGDLSKLDEKEYFNRVIQLARERGGMTRTPSFAVTLAHKMK